MLLEAAIRRCRVGGRILYSTCTYAPEENEAVVDAVLRKMPGAVRILPASLTGLKTSPGLTDWAGKSFHDDLQHTFRIWPHLNDTGGFYIALLEKTDSSACKTIHPPEIAHSDFQTAAGSTQPRLDDVDCMFKILAVRFGICPSDFDGLQFFKKSRRDIYAVAADHRPPQMAKCISGLPLFHMHFKYPKPTTSCAAAFGRKADRNVIDASDEQLQAYLARKPFTLPKDQIQSCNGGGYVLVRYQNAVLDV